MITDSKLIASLDTMASHGCGAAALTSWSKMAAHAMSCLVDISTAIAPQIQTISVIVDFQTIGGSTIGGSFDMHNLTLSTVPIVASSGLKYP